jgi:hypothetical protein
VPSELNAGELRFKAAAADMRISLSFLTLSTQKGYKRYADKSPHLSMFLIVAGNFFMIGSLTLVCG